MISENFFSSFEADAILDFHDYNLLYDFEVKRVLSNFIEDNYFHKNLKVLVITGKGEVVRPVVKLELQSNELVKDFKIAGYFNGQDGAFEVTLKRD